MVIDLQNISWVRQGKQILTDVSWQVNRGENWCLVGLNGSGKTTLLNIFNGLYLAIYWFGDSVRTTVWNG
ncbi:hypothetical protein GCM10020331_049410 [Ectobacillus funiculus]